MKFFIYTALVIVITLHLAGCNNQNKDLVIKEAPVPPREIAAAPVVEAPINVKPKVKAKLHCSAGANSEFVPSCFEKSKEWNASAICPEGAELSKFERYTDNRGRHYYGRSCNVIYRPQSAVNVRAPASETTTDTYITPHGPFIWWRADGVITSTGEFEHGAISGTWIDYSEKGQKYVDK